MLKLLIWVFLGGLTALVNRMPKWNRFLLWRAFAAAVAAAYLANYKPF